MSQGMNDMVKFLPGDYLCAPLYPVLVECVLNNTCGFIIPLSYIIILSVSAILSSYLKYLFSYGSLAVFRSMTCAQESCPSKFATCQASSEWIRMW